MAKVYDCSKDANSNKTRLDSEKENTYFYSAHLDFNVLYFVIPCRITFAKWLFRPPSILLADHLCISVQHIWTLAAILDSFPVEKLPLLID